MSNLTAVLHPIKAGLINRSAFGGKMDLDMSISKTKVSKRLASKPNIFVHSQQQLPAGRR